jgi:hypothetical protein
VDAPLWWKPGRYHVTLKLSSPRNFAISHSQFHFDLNSADVAALKQNGATLENDITNIISSNLPDFKAQPVNWNWANVDVYKT